MSIEQAQGGINAQWEVYTDSDAENESDIALEITKGSEIPLKTYNPGQKATLVFDAETSGFETAEELKAFLQEELGATAVINVETGELENGEQSFSVTIEDSERTIEEYKNGLLFKNGAGETEAGLVHPRREETETTEEAEETIEPETEVTNEDVPEYMQEWVDLRDKAKAELEKDPGSQYWQSMLTHVETTLNQMKTNLGLSPEETTTPEETAPTETTPTDTTPEETIPEDRIPEETTPEINSEFNGTVYKPGSKETIDLFYNAAKKMGMSDAEAKEWANSPALQEILSRESNGIVGVLNYSYGDAGGFGSTPEARAKHLEDLRNGIATTWSSASGLGQLKLENVELYYPSGLAGIGDPLEEAVGMLGYIKAAYGTPENALANHFKTGTAQASARGWDGY